MSRFREWFVRRLWLQRMIDDLHKELRAARIALVAVEADRDRIRKERDELRRDLRLMLERQIRQ